MAIAAHGHPSALDLERRAHEAFAESRRRVYVEQPDVMAALDRFAAGSGPVRGAGLIVEGESGSGKSALVANWVPRFRGDHPETLVVEHYVGASSSSTDHIGLLQRVIVAIRDHAGLDEPLPPTPEEIEEEFPRWLARIGGAGAVIVIDGIDQLAPSSVDLTWLPHFLPAHARVIVTTRDAAAPALEGRGYEVLAIGGLSVGERGEIARRYLGVDAAANVQGDLERFTASPLAANPLFLRVGLDAVRSAGDAPVDAAQVDYYLEAGDLDDLFARLIARAEERHGAAVTRLVLSSIWASRYGLTREELEEVAGAARGEVGPLLDDFAHHLVDNQKRFSLFHEQMRSAIGERALDGHDAESVRAAHRRLGRLLEAGGDIGRTVEELAWQWSRAGDTRRLLRTLTTPEIFQASLAAGREIELLQYWRALKPEYDPTREYQAVFVELRESRDGDPSLASLASDIGEFLRMANEFDGAEEFLATALSLAERVGGERPDLTLTTLTRLGALYNAMGRFRDAEPVLRSAVAAGAPEAGQWRRSVDALDELASSLYGQGNVVGAIELFEEAVGICAGQAGESTLETARVLLDLSTAVYRLGDFERAESLAARALRTVTERAGPRHPLRALALNNIAAVRVSRGELEAALEDFESAMEVEAAAFGPTHRDVATDLVNIGYVYKQLGRWAEAESSYRTALGILESELGADHPELADVLINLGSVLGKTARFEDARDASLRSAAIRAAAHGADSAQHAEARLQAALYTWRMGLLEHARREYETWIPVRERHLGAQHPLTQASKQSHASILAELAASPASVRRTKK